MNASKIRTLARKTKPAKKTIQKVDLSMLTDSQLDALPLDVFLASLNPWGRKFYYAALPFKGKLKAIE